MMTKEELNNRIEKKEAQIEKINKRIQKWENKKNEKDFWKENERLWNKNWETREQFFEKWYKEYIDDCDVEIHRANNDLKENQNTLDNYKEQLNKIINFENEDKIEVLVNFLNNWKEKAYSWYINNANELIELRANEEQALKLAKQDKDYYKRFGTTCLLDNGFEYYTEKHWKKFYYQDITALTFEITSYRGKIDTEKLNKVLEDEKVRKYKDLVNRITKVVGTIEDVAGLTIGAKNGEINGLVKGSKANATVNTISAGGYNIQCFHYRVLVHKEK